MYWQQKYLQEKKKKKFFRIQAYRSITCGYFYIGIIDFIFKNKSLKGFTNLLSPHNFKKNYEVILKATATDTRYFARGKFLRSLVHKKNFGLL